jgi:hypothetical protein
MDYQKLKEEIETGPLAMDLLGRTDAEIAALLNERTATAVQSRFVTGRTILAEIADGADILDALEAASAVIPAVKWAMLYLKGETGIDIGYPSTRAQLDALAVAQVLTTNQAEALKDMALLPASRVEIIGLPSVSYGDVSRALRGPW